VKTLDVCYRSFLVALLLSILFIFPSKSADASATSTGLIISLYTHPGTIWNAVIQEKIAHPSVPMLVIINPDNGPSISKDADYAMAIQELQKSGIVVLGYVYTSYATRNSTAVTAEIDNYKNWYNLNGVFFDEMSNISGNENYYSNLSNYAKSHGFTMTIGNSGTDTLPSYIGTVDNIVIYDNKGLPPISFLGGWYTNYNKNNFSAISYGINNLNKTFVKELSNHVGYLYMTNYTLPNPWIGLPPYLYNLTASLPLSVALTIKSTDVVGNSVSGLPVAIQFGGYDLAKGFLPATFTLNIDQAYNLTSQDLGNYTFDHWQDTASSSRSRTISLSTDTQLVAVYRNITSQPPQGRSMIFASATDLTGKTLSGFYTTLWQDRTWLQSGFTSYPFIVNNDQTYQVAVADYGNYTFNHWSDGVTTRFHNVTTGTGTTTNLNAVYKNINDPLPPSQSSISVNTINSTGNTITGFYTTLWQNGAQIQQGFSSVTFAVSNGQTYQVAVADYGNYTFNHWSDGVTTRLHGVTTGTGTTTSLTAVYSKTS